MSTNSFQVSCLESLSKQLDALHEAYSACYEALPRKVKSLFPSLDKARQELLKLHNAGEALSLEFKDQLALEFLSEDMMAEVDEVAILRDQVAYEYARADRIYTSIKEILKKAGSSVSQADKKALKEIQEQAKAAMNEAHKMIFQLPELGMTFKEFENMSKAERSKLRSRGRPPITIEMMLHSNRAELADLLSYITEVSRGEISTLDEALDGVSLSNRGRPAISPLGKMDRQLSTLMKRYDKAVEEGASEATLQRMAMKISALRDQIVAEENMLEGAEVYQRELEKLRAAHRDLVVAEVEASGEEQAIMLLSILRNEAKQLDVIDEILNIDPSIRVTVTHKVNPKETRQRFERLRNAGLLGAVQLAEVDKLESKFNNYSYSRPRYASDKN